MCAKVGVQQDGACDDLGSRALAILSKLPAVPSSKKSDRESSGRLKGEQRVQGFSKIYEKKSSITLASLPVGRNSRGLLLVPVLSLL